MSLKSVIKLAIAGSSSIARRLAFWYALLSITLIIAFGSVMYSVLKDRLRTEDDQVLTSKLDELRAVLVQHRGDYAHLREEVAREATTSPGTYLRVLDSRGKVIAESIAPDIQAIHDLPFSAVPWQNNNLGQDWVAGDGVKYRVISSTFLADTRFTLLAAMNLSSEEQLLAAYWRTLSLVIVTALAIAIAMGYIIARKGMKPVTRFASIVDGLSAEGLHHRVSEESWPVELQPLAAKFDGLLSRLEDSFARLSRFSADIAHELRTPLHILRGEAELVLTRGGTRDDYRICIESATEEYERLSRMVDSLLFLARMEQPDVHLKKRPLLLNQEVAAVCDYYQAIADEAEIRLSAYGRDTVFADSTLLRRALGNLVANALRHTHKHGKVVVEARQTQNHGAEITVSDTGDGIAPEDLPYVLDRFYRADNARSRGDAGTGIGLAIVRTIMDHHGGAVHIQSERYQGTVIRLSFPPPPPSADSDASCRKPPPPACIVLRDINTPPE